MSRTFRFKNHYEVTKQHSWSHYTHEFGRYTQRGCVWEGLTLHRYYFRAPTKQDLWHEFKYAHSDRKRQLGNNPFFRKVDKRSMNVLHEREMRRWWNDPEYDPQFVPWNRCKNWWD